MRNNDLLYFYFTNLGGGKKSEGKKWPREKKVEEKNGVEKKWLMEKGRRKNIRNNNIKSNFSTTANIFVRNFLYAYRI